MFSLPLDCWKNLKFKLNEDEDSIVVHRCLFKTCTLRIKFGSKCTYVIVGRSWEHVTLETSAQFTALKRMLGPCCHMGVTKERLNKGNGNQVMLNRHSTINIVEHLHSLTTFHDAMQQPMALI